jgi:cyanobactin cluster PatC/TenC/TruC protein
MAESKKSRKKTNETPPETPDLKAEPKSTHILATGLEDYGRWKSIYDKHERDPNEKPFRRGRIWC